MSTRSLLIVVSVVVSIFIIAFGVNTLYRKYSFEEEFFSQVPECTMSDVLAPVLRSYFSERNTKLLGTIINILFDQYAVMWMKEDGVDLEAMARDTEFLMNVLLDGVDRGYIVALIRVANGCLNEFVEQVDILAVAVSSNSQDQLLAQFLVCFLEGIMDMSEPTLDDIHQMMLTMNRNAKRWVEAENQREVALAPSSYMRTVMIYALLLDISQENFHNVFAELLAKTREFAN